MSLLAIAMATVLAGSEPCSSVRREQGEFNARLFDRLARMKRASQRSDGSQRPPTNAEREEFAAIEAEVEAFIARLNERLNICRKD